MRLGIMTSKQKNISVAVFNQSAPTLKNKEHQQGIFTQLYIWFILRFWELWVTTDNSR